MAKMVSYAKTLEKQKKLNFDSDVAKFTDRQMEAVKRLDSGTIKFLLYGGALGGGKSYFLRWILVRLLMTWFQTKGLKRVQVMLACEDYPSLKDRQLSKIGMEFPLWLGKSSSDHKDFGRCFILNDEYGGGVLCFRNLDDSSKYQSAEFAAIAVDELTKNDVDTFTFLRMRLRWPGLRDIECPFIGATNPGGLGHAFCKALWMDKNFPIEFIQPTDYRSMFAYVPSKAEDNPYLDAAYWQMLNTLPPHLRAAFKDGSWDTFVGQAFQEWSRTYHVVEPQKPLVPEGRPIYMTFDWGFGKPFSVGWWWIDSDGRKYRFNEWYGWNGTPDQGLRLVDSEIAEGIIKREQAMGFTVEQGKIINPQITRLCDPTCFNKKPDYRGGGQGPATAEIFMNMGLQMMPGDPSRVLKWRQFHEHLRVPRDEEGNVNGTPMLQVYSSCQHFIRTVPSLVVDPNNIEDVWSDGEDHCFAPETLIPTKLGTFRIRDLVGTEGWVRSLPGEWTKYTGCRLTRRNVDIVSVLFTNGIKVTCTPDHEFLLSDGTWKKALDLTDETCYISIKNREETSSWKSVSLGQQFKNLMGLDITSAVHIFRKKAFVFIVKYGSFIEGQFLHALRSIIKIPTETTMTSEILNFSRTTPIGHFTEKEMVFLNMPFPACTKEQKSGTEATKEENGIKNNGKGIVKTQLEQHISKYLARLAESNFQGQSLQNSVLRSAANEHGSKMVRDYRKEPVSFADKFSGRYGQEVADSVRNLALRNFDGEGTRVVRVFPSGKSDVYCLTVPYLHCFALPGGIIAANCADEAALLLMHRPLTQLPVKEEKKLPPKDITEIAALEREQIWDEIRAAEEREKTEGMFY